MRRVISLLMASLLLWCGDLLLYLCLYDNSQSHGRVASVGALLAALGGSWLWARFFGVRADFASWWLLLNVVTARHITARTHAMDVGHVGTVTEETPK
jgi:hypothetical protein